MFQSRPRSNLSPRPSTASMPSCARLHAVYRNKSRCYRRSVPTSLSLGRRLRRLLQDPGVQRLLVPPLRSTVHVMSLSLALLRVEIAMSGYQRSWTSLASLSAVRSASPMLSTSDGTRWALNGSVRFSCDWTRRGDTHGVLLADPPPPVRTFGRPPPPRRRMKGQTTHSRAVSRRDIKGAVVSWSGNILMCVKSWTIVSRW